MEKSDYITKKSDFIIKVNSSDTNKIWFSSDHHFFHSNILKYCNRPFETVEEMNQALIDNWNSVVGPDDHVYHLGDFCFGNVEKWNTVLAPGVLNGHIHLILGNHDPDRVFREGTMLERFDSIDYQKILVIEGWTVILNHFPFASFSNNLDHKVLGLSGHTHVGPRSPGVEDNDFLNNIYKPNQYDVGVDNNNYTPVSWREVINKITFQIENNVNLLYWLN